MMGDDYNRFIPATIKNWHVMQNVPASSTVVAATYIVPDSMFLRIWYYGAFGMGGASSVIIQKSTDGGSTWDIVDYLASPQAKESIIASRSIPLLFNPTEKLRLIFKNETASAQDIRISASGVEN